MVIENIGTENNMKKSCFIFTICFLLLIISFNCTITSTVTKAATKSTYSKTLTQDLKDYYEFNFGPTFYEVSWYKKIVSIKVYDKDNPYAVIKLSTSNKEIVDDVATAAYGCSDPELNKIIIKSKKGKTLKTVKR
jgi:hypothetical protein